VLQRPRASDRGLLLEVEDPHQRRRVTDRLLPPGPQGLLHHVPRVEGALLTPFVAMVVAASIVAGLSTLFSP
jgi:hypothetical protein